MAKQGAKTVRPRLRFPEFRSAAGWKAAPLNQIAERISTKNRDGRVSRVLTNSAEFGVLDQRDYFDKDIATAGKVDGYCIVGKGDYVYNPRTSAIAPVGPISRNNVGEGVMSPLYTVFRFLDVQTDFYEHYFRSAGWHSYLRSAASTGARHDRMSITTEAFMRMPLPVPTPAEQQRIADCLTSLDEVIAAQGRKVEALKAHKRGLMQQLFPREGETRPRLRFPEFRDAPDWREVSIGGIGEVITGSTPATSQREYYGGDHPFVSPADISDSRFVESTKTNLTDAGFAQARAVKAGSVLFVCIGSTIGKVAQNVRDCATNQQINAVVANSEFLGDFVYFLLDMEAERIAGLAGRQAVPIINKTLFSSVKVLAPRIGEQQRIADCLSSLDTRITAETNQLTALKTHKQGLMQQLFPAPDATTA